MAINSVSCGHAAGPKKFDEYQKNMEDELIAEKKAATAKRKLLTKLLRQKMQTACTNTKTLPRDLWDKFKTADGDGSGRLEFDEYCQVMAGVGLGANELGMQGLKTLYRIADKDGNGNIGEIFFRLSQLILNPVTTCF